MDVTVAYHGRSEVKRGPGGLAVSLEPNLRRDCVSFDALLKQPLRFREAISALHDVVVSDLRFKPKDRTAYQAYLKVLKRREDAIRKAARELKADQILKEFPQKRREEIKERYSQLKSVYWNARQKYSDFLQEHDPELFRLIVPLDPVCTVAPDVLLFECFSADESSYGCLSVGRDAFSTEKDVSLGTTNVDYSWRLYDHFQELRSYRKTRFTIDPAGFEVKTESDPTYREEKIDLPQGWLRGFMQLQSAMSLPMRRVPMSREGVYNVLSYLKRHRARKSPRAVRFELTPGKPVAIVLEPFEARIVVHDKPYPGPMAEVIRTWGRDRLQTLARLLPLIESADVYLLGTGLPSFWVVNMGELRMTLGLSGWTKNDWTGASALDQLMPPAEPSKGVLADIAATFQKKPMLTFREVQQQTGAAPAYVAAGLNRLALLGQVIHDLPTQRYRWRQVMPVTLSMDQMGPENPETAAARELVRKGQVQITRDEETPTGLRALAGNVPERPTTILLDKDNRITRGKCNCSFFYQYTLRRGPCRHMQALRNAVLQGGATPSMEKWFEQLARM